MNGSTPSVVSRLPEPLRRLWENVRSNALATYGDDEARAESAAWAAVKRRKRRQNVEGTSMGIRDCSEAITFAGSQVEADKRLVRGVSLIGVESSNGYKFTRRALEGVVGKLAGTKIYIDHDEGKRRFTSVRDLAGQISEAWFDEAAGRVRGDIQVRSDSNGTMILQDAQTNPGMAGFSMDHRSRFDERRNEITEIVQVRRVDYVADPATTRGMFESKPSEEAEEMKIEDLTIEELREARPDLVSVLTDEGKAKSGQEAKLAAAQQENATLREKLAGLEQEKAQRAHGELVNRVLAEAKLVEEAATTIRPVLEACKDEAAMTAVLAGIVKAQEAQRTKSEETTGPGTEKDEAKIKAEAAAVWNSMRRR